MTIEERLKNALINKGLKEKEIEKIIKEIFQNEMFAEMNAEQSAMEYIEKNSPQHFN